MSDSVTLAVACLLDIGISSQRAPRPEGQPANQLRTNWPARAHFREPAPATLDVGAELADSLPMPKVAFRKFLCPTDFSSASDYGVTCALSLATDIGEGAQLHLVSVVEQPGMPGSKLAKLKWREAEEKMKEFLEARLPALREELGAQAVAVTSELVPGDPADVLADLCERRVIDAVVIATRGKTGLERIMVGSVTAQLIQRCACPVMVVRQPPPTEPK
jgi:nucleotide-binding universal stress UspA family protein